jgi:hypothetical protein
MPPNYQRSLFQVTELRNALKDSDLLRYNLSKVTENSTTVHFRRKLRGVHLQEGYAHKQEFVSSQNILT